MTPIQKLLIRFLGLFKMRTFVSYIEENTSKKFDVALEVYVSEKTKQKNVHFVFEKSFISLLRHNDKSNFAIDQCLKRK